jgi:hypothetical protein
MHAKISMQEISIDFFIFILILVFVDFFGDKNSKNRALVFQIHIC